MSYINRLLSPQYVKLILAAFVLMGAISCSTDQNKQNNQKETQTGQQNQKTQEQNYQDVRSQPQMNEDQAFQVKIEHPQWLRNASIYEVNVRQYTEEGTFNAFAEHLPRLKKMGVEVLWLMPIHPIGEKNRKGELGSYYSVKDYYKVNPEFGTMQDFKKLVNKVHQHGMHIIIGWIANHTSWDNPLTQEHPEWYERDKEGNLMSPPGTDWTDVVLLDVQNKEMQQYMIDAMTYWVKETNIDGYRADVAGWAPNEFWNSLRAELDKIKPVFMLAEAEKPILHEKAFDVSYAWHFSRIINEMGKGEKKVDALKKYFTKYAQDFPDDGIRMNFTTNHDQNSWEGTVYERFGEAANTYFTLVATMPGIPLIYSGQEIGLDRRLPFFKQAPINWDMEKNLIPFYKALVKLKKENRALWNGKFGGDIRILNVSNHKKVFAYYREKEKDKVLTVLNFSGSKQSVNLRGKTHTGSYNEVFTNKETSFTGGDRITLQPYGYKVYSHTTEKSQGNARKIGEI